MWYTTFNLNEKRILSMNEKRGDFKLKDVEQKEDGTYRVTIETPEGVTVQVPPEK
ncbi:hypothetical protein [Staphylococcus xylosus]|uniref:hypothetical protein n=1 Tax=Staphylococcus xylosus TaxID=1288 RepID=UPI0015D664D2|nr:hypothetical protein [Staphylococcus xylosus]